MIASRDFSGAIINQGFVFIYDQIPDFVPDQAKEKAKFGEWVEFNPFTLSGVEIPIPVSIVGGEFKVSNDGESFDDFSQDERAVSSGAVIVVRVMASSNPMTLTEAVISLGLSDVTLSVRSWSGVYSSSKEQLKLSRTNDLVFVHDGADIPETAPKHPKAIVYKGFELLGLEDDESISSYSFLINDQEVSEGESVDGLVFLGSETNWLNKAKAMLSGGTVGKRYLLTLNYSTQYVPSDYRSQEFEVRVL